MSDEFQKQINPDNTPGAVSTGYQTQNTNSEIARQAIDKSVVNPGASVGDIDIEISGGVDVNGVMFSCKTITTLTVPTGTYYIKLTAGSTVDFLTPVLQVSRGALVDSKDAYYDSGERILNWSVYNDGVNAVIVSKFAVNDGLAINTINNGIYGTINAFDISSYVNSSSWTAQSHCILFRVGNVVFLNAACSIVSVVGNQTVFTNIPVEWRPSSRSYLVCQTIGGVDDNAESYIDTNGTIYQSIGIVGTLKTRISGMYLLT